MVSEPLKPVHWHGDTLEVTREFPRSARVSIGSELYLLQLGQAPLHSRPIPGVGRGVWEIRIKNQGAAFRVFYVIRRHDGIHVLHAFQKKTRKTRKSDIEIGRLRYRAVLRTK